MHPNEPPTDLPQSQIASLVDALRATELRAVLLADQRRCWRSGQRVLAEVYREHLPRLRQDDDLLFDLVWSEALLRQELGETPTPDEYAERFPDLAERLRRQFGLQGAVTDAGLPDPAGGSDLPERLRAVASMLSLPGSGQATPGGKAAATPEAVGESLPLPRAGVPAVGGPTLAQTPEMQQRAAQLSTTGGKSLHIEGYEVIKPPNVLLTEDGTPKITDFGLAKRVQGGPKAPAAGGLTATGAVMDTPSYMAPEQARGETKAIGPAADVYALGAILYECLTGRPPFRAATALDTLLQVISEEAVAVRQLQPGVPADLETICHKCLQKEPDKRYAAHDLAEDLRRFQAGEPIAARPVGQAERAWRWCRRNPVVAGLLTTVAAVLLLGAAVALALAVWALGERDRADHNAATARQREQDAVARKAEADDARTRADDAARRSRESERRAVREKEQKEKTLADLGYQLSVLARNYGERGEQAFRAGNVPDSLNWVLRAYEVAPPDDPLRAGYRRLLAAWARDLEKRLVHDDVVVAAACSPDGRTVLTGSHDGTARLWETATGKELGVLRHDRKVRAVAWSPDGRTVLTGSRDGTAQLWEAATGKRHATLHHGDAVAAVAWSPDGGTVLTGGWDHEARLWDPATGRELATLSHEDRVKAVAYSPDGRTVLTAGDDGTARLWEVATGKPRCVLRHDKAVGRMVQSRQPSFASLSSASVLVCGDLVARILCSCAAFLSSGRAM
jgi:hypothetical protein